MNTATALHVEHARNVGITVSIVPSDISQGASANKESRYLPTASDCYTHFYSTKCSFAGSVAFIPSREISPTSLK